MSFSSTALAVVPAFIVSVFVLVIASSENYSGQVWELLVSFLRLGVDGFCGLAFLILLHGSIVWRLRSMCFSSRTHFQRPPYLRSVL